MRALIPLLAAALLGCQPAPYDPSTSDGFTPVEPLPYSGFSWLLPETLAGMPRPGRYDLGADLDFLAEQGLTLLVSVNTEPPDSAEVLQRGMAHEHWPVEDFTAPTQQQLLAFAERTEAELDAGGRVGVHCDFGLGRTGTFLASWLVWTGMDAQEAIDTVRGARPGSIETLEQEEAVRRFALL